MDEYLWAGIGAMIKYRFDCRCEISESGVSLIMAIAFIFAMGIVISAVATFAAGALTTSYNLGQERALEANAESAATISIANERFTYDSNVFTSDTIYDCMPSSAPIYPSAVGTAARMTVFCNALSNDPGSPNSRELQFSVCPVSSSATSAPSSCAQVELYAVVTYDDLPPNAAPSADTCPTIATPHLNTCGIAMTILTWDVRTADN